MNQINPKSVMSRLTLEHHDAGSHYDYITKAYEDLPEHFKGSAVFVVSGQSSESTVEVRLSPEISVKIIALIADDMAKACQNAVEQNKNLMLQSIMACTKPQLNAPSSTPQS